MKKKLLITLAAAAGLLTPSFGDTPILENPEFSSFEGWITGSNVFVGGIWQAFVTDAYTVDDRVDPQGDGFVFTSWDDGESDTIETYLFQEWGAGPAGSAWPAEFNAGDIIVFKGMASATLTGNNTSDVIVRAFIKTLGYVDNLEFQIKPDYTEFHNIGSSLEPFELSVSFPDAVADDSFQVLQVGFEITTNWDGSAMDAGTIYFQDLQAYVEGDEAPTWFGFTPDASGNIDTRPLMGWVNVSQDPYVYSWDWDTYMYVPAGQDGVAGFWAFMFRDNNDPVGNNPTWFNLTPSESGDIDTRPWMGWINVASAPFVYSWDFDTWMYVPAEQDGVAGVWLFILR